MTQLEVIRRQSELLESINKTLKRIEWHLRPKNVAVMFEFKKYKITGSIQQETEDMNLQLGQNARVRVTAIKDAAGNAALVDGALSWSVSGAQNLGALEVAEDGMSALFVRNGAVGTCQVEVRGDADLGEGQREIVGVVEVVCLGGEATVFELSAEAEAAAPAPAEEEVVPA